MAMCSIKRESSRDSNVVREPYSEREAESHLSIGKSSISWNCDLIKLLEEEKLLYHNYLMQNIKRDWFLRSKKDYSLTEARSELDMQELRVAVYSSTLQGWNSTRRIIYLTILREREDTELDRRERVLPEDRKKESARNTRIEKMCCTETETAKQLRVDVVFNRKKVNLQ